MEQPMHIRALGSAHLDDFWTLRLLALSASPDAFGSTLRETETEGRQAMLARLGDASDCTSWGAFDHGLIGTVGLRRETRAKERHKANVFGLFVHPTARRRGVGEALMRTLLERARLADGLEQLHLTVVATEHGAIRLYERLGFETYGIARGALRLGTERWDELLMMRTVGA